MPSWVPDWRNDLPVGNGSFDRKENPERIREPFVAQGTIIENPYFSACGTRELTQSLVIPIDESEEIDLPGYKVEVVAKAGSAYLTGKPEAQVC